MQQDRLCKALQKIYKEKKFFRFDEFIVCKMCDMPLDRISNTDGTGRACERGNDAQVVWNDGVCETEPDTYI